MDKTLGYLLCCQSPALFLGALALLAGYIIRHRNHRVHAALDLVLAAIVIVGLFVQNIGKAAARRRSEKEAARAEDARRKELEEAKSAAFASGQAAAASAQPDPQEKTEEKLE